LAQYLGIDPGVEIEAHEEAGRFVSVRTISSHEDHGRLMSDVVTLLHLADEPEQARAVHYVLSELIRNVREHSQSEDGAVVCAQYYAGAGAARRYVSVGVADTGVGVHRSLSWNYPHLSTDAQAVLTAIQPGVTGARPGPYGSTENAGAGLFYTRRLAEASETYFAIGSGGAMFRTSIAQRPPQEDDLVFPITPYPGTMVAANFGLEREVDFDDFLQMTGRAFSRLDQQLRERVDERVRFT
jgi:anti-sigma regulatory factor (Ser/Thr protein kinase)